MRINEWPGAQSAILGELNAQALSYNQQAYSALVTPSSVMLDASTGQQLHEDIADIWSWFRGWRTVYGDLLEAGDESNAIMQASEWGLDTVALEYQRESTRRREDPLFGRIDSVSLDGSQQIAEVQWKGGGEGFIAAIDATYRRLFPLGPGTSALGDLAVNWGRTLRNSVDKTGSSDGTIHMLNTGRELWRQGEGFLARALGPTGIEWSFSPPGEIAQNVSVRNGRAYMVKEGRERPLDIIYLDRLSEAIPPDMMAALSKVALEGKLRIDPPPSYLFNQKVGLALPFMQEYRGFFSDRVREILIPSVLVMDSKPDCEPLIPSISHHKRDLLAGLETWEDLLSLPRNLREQLVFKCASTHQRDNHGGRGVWRLWGSTAVAKRSLDEVLGRVRGQQEPWILQPYVNTTWEVPLAHPEQAGDVQRATTHARFGLYCGYAEGTAQLLGGITTLSPFWKVAGKTAGYDNQNRLTGSAFTDIRVEQ